MLAGGVAASRGAHCTGRIHRGSSLSISRHCWGGEATQAERGACATFRHVQDASDSAAEPATLTRKAEAGGSGKCTSRPPGSSFKCLSRPVAALPVLQAAAAAALHRARARAIGEALPGLEVAGLVRTGVSTTRCCEAAAATAG